jgi:hypothetical protein
MPSPREIAIEKNEPRPGEGFESEPNDESLNPQPKEKDWRANPSNPNDGPIPARVK